MDVSAVTEGFERALAQDFPDKQKLLFSKRKLEFLGDFGTDLAKIEDTKHEHNKLVAIVKPSSGWASLTERTVSTSTSRSRITFKA